MTTASGLKWMQVRVEQEPKRHQPYYLAINSNCLRLSHKESQVSSSEGGFTIGVSDWLATERRGVIGRILAHFSVARRIQEVNHPLLLAKSRPKNDYARILIPIDFSPASVSAAKAVLTTGTGAQLVFLTSFNMFDAAALHARARHMTDAPPLSEVCRTAHTRLERFVEQLSVQANLVSVVVRHGTLDTVTCSYADLMRADLVIIGRRSVPRSEAILLGRPEWRLSQNVDGDILVVPE